MQSLACDLWLMEQGAFRQFIALANSKLRVDEPTALAAASATERRQKQIAILPIHGALEARPSFMGQFFGMSSYEAIGKTFDRLMNDESVAGVVLDVASPGGMVYGAMELADKIFQARGRKPVVAVANPMAASAAYWIASAADRLVVTPSGDVGSVGVVMEHIDFSARDERDGAKVTVIRSKNSPYKAEGMGSLTDEAIGNQQARADAIYDRFAGDLAKFRGVSVDHVNSSFGQGRVVDSRRAMSAGMVDRVGTLDEIAHKLAEGRIRIASERAQDDWDAPTRREAIRDRIAAIHKEVEAN